VPFITSVGPSSPHSDVRETPTPMCRQPEFDSQSTQPTPQWSDTQDIGYPNSGSMSFTELLQSHWGPPADDADHSQWQPQADKAGGSPDSIAAYIADLRTCSR
jgi:hypothetical protein